MTPALLVGIAGGSGSGKTTLARRVLAEFSHTSAVLVPSDAYYQDLSHLPPTEQARRNFDHPDALDTGLLAEHLIALRFGRTVDVPRYDFATHSRVGGPAPTGPAPLVVVEGVLVLAVEELRSCLDLGVFVAARAEVRLERRLRRDVVERGRDRESVLRQWHASVQPMHEALVGPSRRHAHVVVSGEEAESSSLAALVSRIRMALATRRD